MKTVHYLITGLGAETKPGTYTVQVSSVHEYAGLVYLSGSLVADTQPADRDVVDRVNELHGLLMRPLFVLRQGHARAHSDNPSIARSGRTAAARAAAEVDRIVRAWVSSDD